MKKQKPIQRIKTNYQTIDIIHNESSKSLLLNGFFQFSLDHEREYHEYFVHVPLHALDKKPKEVLVLGAGDGLAIREMLKYQNFFDEITHVELDPGILQLAKFEPWLRKANESSLHSPRVNTIIADAFIFLRNSTKRFDAIYIDFPVPYSYDLERLFSIEFYRFAKRKLKSDGFIVFDFPRFDESIETKLGMDRNWMGMEKTLEAAGFKTVVPYFTKHLSSLESFLIAVPDEVEVEFNYRPWLERDYRVLNEAAFEKLQELKYLDTTDSQKVRSVFSPVSRFRLGYYHY